MNPAEDILKNLPKKAEEGIENFLVELSMRMAELKMRHVSLQCPFGKFTFTRKEGEKS